MKAKGLVTQSCPALCDPMNCSPPGSCPWESPGKNTGVDFHALLQGIYPTQRLNPDLLHFRHILYCLSHQGSPRTPKVKWLVKIRQIQPSLAWDTTCFSPHRHLEEESLFFGIRSPHHHTHTHTEAHRGTGSLFWFSDMLEWSPEHLHVLTYPNSSFSQPHLILPWCPLRLNCKIGAAIMENSMEGPQKAKNRATTWSSNTTPRHISRQNHNSEGCMRLHQCSQQHYL